MNSSARLGIALWLAVMVTGIIAQACTTTANRAPPARAASVQCLPMVEYSKAEQQKAAQELKGLPEGSMLAKFVIDYGALRKADRACQETQGH